MRRLLLIGIVSQLFLGVLTGSAEAYPGCSASSLAEQNLSGCDLREAFASSPRDPLLGIPVVHPEGRNLRDANLGAGSSTSLIAFLSGADLRGANLTGRLIGGSLEGANLSGATGGSLAILTNIDGAVFAGSTVSFNVSVSGKPASLPDGVAIIPVITVPPCSSPCTSTPPCPDKQAAWDALFYSGQRTVGCSFQISFKGSSGWKQAYWVLNKGQSIHDAPTSWSSLMGDLSFDATQAMVGLNLARVDLTGTDLSGARLEGSDLSSANREKTDLSRIDAGGTAVPEEASSSGVGRSAAMPKKGVKLFKAKLTGSNVAGAKLRFAGLSGVVSGGLKGTPASLPSGWRLTVGYLVGPKANLTNANLFNADLASINLAAANLTGVKSCGVKSKPASLPVGWVGVGSCLIGPKANLSNSNLTGLDFGTASLSGTNLTGATLTGAKLAKANLTGVISSGLKGIPASLPSGWSIKSGKFVEG